jgi:putative membrane protein
MHADPVIDLVGAAAFLELEDYPGSAEDAAWLESVIVARFGRPDLAGGDLPRWFSVYRRFYAFYFSDSAEVDPRLYAWCLRQLRG